MKHSTSGFEGEERPNVLLYAYFMDTYRAIRTHSLTFKAEG